MRAAVAVLAAVLLAAPAQAATITVVNLDGPGEGLNDPSPRTPVGGNPGLTLGEQRLNVLQFVADIWGSLIDSNVTIIVGANFDNLGGGPFSATLGAAGPEAVYQNFHPSVRANTWYPDALADAIAGVDQGGGSADIGTTFNSAVDNSTVLGNIDWYYGYDGNAGGDIDLVSTVLHEYGHGLGFLTLVDSSGQRFFGIDDIFMVFLEDHASGLAFPDMSNAQRASAMVSGSNLHFTGTFTVAGAVAEGQTGCRDVSGHVLIYAPNPYEGGSSTSHFDTSCSPDELMEPFDTGPQMGVGLTDDLFADLGWAAGPTLLCGNGVIDAGEGCDDTNRDAGDGCNGNCQIEPCWGCAGEPSVCTPDDGASCSDGVACTIDQCNAGVCESTWDDLTCALDSFKFYKSKNASASAKFASRTVNLADLVETKDTDVIKPFFLGNPADVEGAGTNVPEGHFECYKIRDNKSPAQPKLAKTDVETTDALFGTQTHTLVKARHLCVPAAKDLVSPPAPLPVATEIDHFKCYKAKLAKGQSKPAEQNLNVVDQFENKQTLVQKIAEVCVAVDKDGAGIFHAADHLACYKSKDAKVPAQPKFAKTDAFVRHGFGAEKLTAIKPQRLCVPTTVTPAP